MKKKEKAMHNKFLKRQSDKALSQKMKEKEMAIIYSNLGLNKKIVWHKKLR